MVMTAAGATLIAIGREAGLVDYDVSSGRHDTSKLARFRLPNNKPIVLQTNNKSPRIWMLRDQEQGLLSCLGTQGFYAPTRPRHHHLDQVREFRKQELVKVIVSTASWPLIKAAFLSVGGSRTSGSTEV